MKYINYKIFQRQQTNDLITELQESVHYCLRIIMAFKYIFVTLYQDAILTRPFHELHRH